MNYTVCSRTGAFWRVVLIVGLLVALPVTGVGAMEPDAIIELARTDRNRDAIDAFEALPPDGGPYSLVLLRSVAGCYWREREFDHARALYDEILKRRPTLQGLSPEEGGHPDHKVEPPLKPEAVPEPVAIPDRQSAAGDLDVMLNALRQEYATIEMRLRKREQAWQARTDVLQAETEAAVLEADAVNRRLAEEQRLRSESDDRHAAREAGLQDQIQALDAQIAQAAEALEVAQAALEQAGAKQVQSDALQAAERDALRGQIGELTTASALLHQRVDALLAELENEQAINRQLRTWHETRESTIDQEVKALVGSVIENALSEIDQLEREYAQLHAESTARQAALQQQLEQLTDSASTAQLAVEQMKGDLDRERSMRESLEARENELEQSLNEAQFALRTVASGVLDQLARIHNELVEHKVELRISQKQDAELSDMSPLLNRLEEAARESAAETAVLRNRLAEQSDSFEVERAVNRESVDRLERSLTIVAERNTDLEATLLDSQSALVDSEMAMAKLRGRLLFLESAFSTPSGVFDPDLLSGVERVLASIAQTAQDDPTLALEQFERLPEDTVVPVSLLVTMAVIYRDQQNLEAARELYARALVLKPGDLQIERQLIMTLFDMGRSDEARMLLDQTGVSQRSVDK